MNPQRSLELFSHPGESVQLATSLLDAVDEALLLMDAERKVYFCNQTAEKVLGCSRRDLQGKTAAHCPVLQELVEQLPFPPTPVRGQSKIWHRLQIDLPHAKRAAMEVTVSTVPCAERSLFTLCLRDISREQEVEKALFQSQKTQAIGALAGGVAHDFNNILTAIISHLDLIAFSDELPTRLKEHALHAQTSARRGAELVGKLLMFSRRNEVALDVVDVGALVKEVVVMLRRSINPSIQIVSDFSEQTLWAIQADANQIMQVLMNLCLNARDAMPEGGELRITLTNMTVRESDTRPPRRSGQFVRLTVSDTGEGMTSEVLNHLFEPYFTTKPEGRGTGLGLTIAATVIDEHSGWLEVESRLHQGSQFHVHLPRADAAKAQTASASPTEWETASLEGKEHVLVVDDEELVRLVIRAVLSYRGYQISEAVHGKEALAKYRLNPSLYDLILLDIHMPRLNGWDTLTQIKEINPEAKVILLSGGLVENAQTRARELRAASFLSKPFENRELLRAVRNALDHPQGMPDSQE